MYVSLTIYIYIYIYKRMKHTYGTNWMELDEGGLGIA